MQRRGLIAGGACLAVLAIGLLLYLESRGDPEASEAARIGEGSGESARARGGSSVEGTAGEDVEASAEVARRGASADTVGGGQQRGDIGGDAGVRRAVLPAPSEPLESPGRTAPREDVPAPANERSAGWRMGQARRHVEIVEPRIAHMEELVRDFEQQGDTASAERQRRVLQRFQNRLAELREDLSSLEAQAQEDGTLGEADQGYEDTAPQASRPPAREGPGGSIVRAPATP